MASPNQVALQRLLRKKNPITAQLRADVPPSTLLRHATRAKIPQPQWLAFYKETLGWSLRGWFTPAQSRAVAKRGQRLRELVQEEGMRERSLARTFSLSDKEAP